MPSHSEIAIRVRLPAGPKARALVLLATLAAIPQIGHAQSVPWPDKGWPVRRLVTVEIKATPNAKGDEVAVVELPTDGLARADGSDIRVANAIGRFVPMRLLCVGPGTTARVAFAAPPGKNTFAVYYGNARPQAAGQEQALDIRRGLLLETATFAGGQINTCNGTTAAFERSAKAAGGMQGADFVGNVFHGNNIFGPSGRTISRYTGWLLIPAAGDYGFATSSDDASFIVIDGKLVVEWGGYHGWVGDARHNKTVNMSAGVHAFEYLHVNVAADGGCVAAWRPPGAKQWVQIPESAFLPVFRGVLGAREQFGTLTAAEMSWQHAGEAAIGIRDDYVQRYRFTSRPNGFDARSATFTWDFGDGIVASGGGLDSVEHVYLADGPVEVSVTVSQGNRKESVRNRVVISRHWPSIGTARPQPLAGFIRVIESYDFTKLSPASLAVAMDVFAKAKSSALYVKAGHALAATAGPVDDKLLLVRMPEYAEFLLEHEADGAKKAAEDYLAAAGRAVGPFTRAAMFNGAGRILLDRLNSDPKAEQCFAESLKFAGRGEHDAIKAAHIGMGDVFRRRGDGAKAMESYAKAEKMQATMSANRSAVEVGSLARSIEYYVRQGEFEAALRNLQDWDWQFPTHKLAGYSTLLWVRYYQARKQHALAVQEASDLVGAAERSNYAPQLLLAAAESWLALGDRGKARQLLEHLIAVYKESPLVAEAKKKLAEMGK